MRNAASDLFVWRDIGRCGFCSERDFRPRLLMPKKFALLPLDEAIAPRAVFVIVSESDARTETLLGPAR